MNHEELLLQRAKDGDQAAFGELVTLYEKKVYALTLRMCKHPEDAAEAAQEAFLAAWQGLKFFRGEASFSTWLYRLASKASVDLLRREQRHKAGAGPALNDEDTFIDIVDDAPSPQLAAERSELRKQIEEGTYRFEDEVEVYSLPRVYRYIPLGKARVTHDAENGFVLEGTYRDQPYRIQRLPHETNSLHVEYDFGPLYQKDFLDISTENDSFYCAPSQKNVITKLAFATEEIYQRSLRERAARRS